MVVIVAFLTILVIIVVVIKVAVIEVRVAVVKVMVWVAAIGGMVVVGEVLVIDVLADVEIIAVGVIVIVLKFVLTVSYSVGVPSDMAVDLFMNDLTGVMLDVLTEIGIEVSAGVNATALTVVMTDLEFPMSAP